MSCSSSGVIVRRTVTNVV